MKMLDDRQSELYKVFPDNHPLHNPAKLERFLLWITFWRRNVLLFVKDYLGLKLYMYQNIWLWFMWESRKTVIIAARSDAKTFMLAVYSVVRCILYPGTKIKLISNVKSQGKKLVDEKIQQELMSACPNIRAEIKDVSTNNNKDISVTFHNGSTITVVILSDNSLGNRSNTNGYEEAARMNKKELDRIAKPFLVLRKPPFSKMPEYEHLIEDPKEIVITSSWFGSSWIWKDYDEAFESMLSDGTMCALACDFALAAHHGIKPMWFMRREKKNTDPATWRTEYENMRIIEGEDSYFTHDLLARNQRLHVPMYPRKDASNFKKPNQYFVPKLLGEIRVLACDFAFVGGKSNDNSIFTLLRALPERRKYVTYGVDGSRNETANAYRRAISYVESINGGDVTKQAVRIKQLHDDFDVDYVVLDLRNAGIAVYDLLTKVLYDDIRGKEYAPWGCMNDEKFSDMHPSPPGAPQIVYAINATAKLNSDIAIDFRNVLSEDRIDFLIGFDEALDSVLVHNPDYLASISGDEQFFYESPYHETKALIGETVSLVYEKDSQTGRIKIEERGNERKDRYTSVSYGNHFITLLEQGLSTCNEEYEFRALCN